jgi:hypothetical protein
LALAWLLPLAALADPAASPPAPRPAVQVYKQSTCGCCRTWAKYLEANGFPVTATDTNALIEVRLKHGVPLRLAGCHTALVDGYVIEGHVSVAEIEYLLTTRPRIKGLMVSGMPKGSPGMEGVESERYDVLALHDDGSTSVFATHEAAPESAGPAAPAAAVDPAAPVSPAVALPQ